MLIRISLGLAALVLGLAVIADAAKAADYAVGYSAPRHRVYKERIVVRRHLGCPDRYSCSALYGAYGPYGGVAYWDAYTAWIR